MRRKQLCLSLLHLNLRLPKKEIGVTPSASATGHALFLYNLLCCCDQQTFSFFFLLFHWCAKDVFVYVAINRVNNLTVLAEFGLWCLFSLIDWHSGNFSLPLSSLFFHQLLTYTTSYYWHYFLALILLFNSIFRCNQCKRVKS